MAVGPEEVRLSELLVRWEELREQGEDVPVEKLCAGDPALAAELRRRITVLEKMGFLH